MKWWFLLVALVFGCFVYLAVILTHPLNVELASQSIIMANDTLGANVVANNFSYFGPMMRMISWLGVLGIPAVIFFVGYTIIKSK